MKPQDLRKLLDDYGMKRCYLVPLKNKLETIDGQKVQAYKEGWVEFDDKIYAKLAEYQLNGRKIGGSKKCPYKDELWNLKYLHKFKWNNLIENITMEKKIIEKKLKTEIAQSKRESDFIVKNYEKSKRYLNKKTNENNTEENNTSEKNDNEKNFDKKNNLSKLNSKIEILNNNLKTKEHEISIIQNTLSEKEQIIKNKDKQINEYNNIINDNKTKNSRNKNDLQNLTMDNSKLKNEIQTLKVFLTDREKTIDSLKNSLSFLTKTFKEKNIKKNLIEENSSKDNEAISGLKMIIDKLQKEISELNRINNLKEKEKIETERQLNEYNENYEHIKYDYELLHQKYIEQKSPKIIISIS